MVIGPFIFQEDLILYGNNEQKLFQVPARENLQFKIDLFLLRFLISNDRSKLSSLVTYRIYYLDHIPIKLLEYVPRSLF